MLVRAVLIPRLSHIALATWDPRYVLFRDFPVLFWCMEHNALMCVNIPVLKEEQVFISKLIFP